MKKQFKIIILSSVVLTLLFSFLVYPSPARAFTMSDLQSKIQVLLGKINELKQQLDEMKKSGFSRFGSPKKPKSPSEPKPSGKPKEFKPCYETIPSGSIDIGKELQYFQASMPSGTQIQKYHFKLSHTANRITIHAKPGAGDFSPDLVAGLYRQPTLDDYNRIKDGAIKNQGDDDLYWRVASIGKGNFLQLIKELQYPNRGFIRGEPGDVIFITAFPPADGASSGSYELIYTAIYPLEGKADIIPMCGRPYGPRGGPAPEPIDPPNTKVIEMTKWAGQNPRGAGGGTAEGDEKFSFIPPEKYDYYRFTLDEDYDWMKIRAHVDFHMRADMIVRKDAIPTKEYYDDIAGSLYDCLSPAVIAQNCPLCPGACSGQGQGGRYGRPSPQCEPLRPTTNVYGANKISLPDANGYWYNIRYNDEGDGEEIIMRPALAGNYYVKVIRPSVCGGTGRGAGIAIYASDGR